SSDLEGLTITPADDFSGSFDLGVTAQSADGEDVATTTGSITVDVAGVADAPTLDVTDASGSEDSAIALDIDAGLTDSSETLPAKHSPSPSPVFRMARPCLLVPIMAMVPGRCRLLTLKA
ncbi:hypothetical protein, partial [Thalassospira profundimaris]|uniref:hypothetical protein n=1 Tax=Thalassospira profundimaris TaxID=502049 RepID=UPI0015F0D13B